MTPAYQEALAALSRAADAMTRTCNDYQQALRSAAPGAAETPELAALRERCDAAGEAHDEALADAWELIEEGAMDEPTAPE